MTNTDQRAYWVAQIIEAVADEDDATYAAILEEIVETDEVAVLMIIRSLAGLFVTKVKQTDGDEWRNSIALATLQMQPGVDNDD